ncbi:PLP-dependent aminotransferase family protein [Listeria sp. PSOL-1]|uniref:aminotransferase-like domain-containing protein n=1 Tax=Listeria sp. PSOL-1 TaxID=1844999 RepID=UPI0013D69B1F|nr:PLP-dependent aminotransferase family protein [Listeria sp. PSOL-1]
MWNFQKQEKKPLYQQIVCHIEKLIETGKLLPGERLPSERKLAERLGVNRSTIIHVFDELETAGMIIRKKGSGTYVNEDKWGILTTGKTNWRHYVSQGAFHTNLPYIRSMRELGKQFPKEVIDLATGELPVELLPPIQVPNLSWQSFLKKEGAEDPFGYLPLRKTIKTHMQQKLGISTDHEEILITSGAQQALFLITQCLLSPGDAIAIEAPSYFYSLSLFQSAGLRIYALPVNDFGVDLNVLEELYSKHRVKMVFLNPTFQNPTGMVMTKEQRQCLIACCARLKIPIVEDDPFGQFTYDVHSLPRPLKQLDAENVLYIGSLSKVMGSTTRIGWLAGPRAVVERLAAARQEMDFGLSIFPQVLADDVLNSTSYFEHIKKLQTLLAERKEWLVSALNAYLPNGISYNAPLGGLSLWVKLTDFDTLTHFNLFLEKKLLVMPGFLFGVKTSTLRLTFARLNETLAEEAVRRLAMILGRK